MPEHPTWSVVIVKLAKALAVMTISYFLLMALYFGAEVRRPPKRTSETCHIFLPVV